MTPAQDDPINEIRAYREALAARFNYDIDAIFDEMKRQRELVEAQREAQQIVPEVGTTTRPNADDRGAA